MSVAYAVNFMFRQPHDFGFNLGSVYQFRDTPVVTVADHFEMTNAIKAELPGAQVVIVSVMELSPEGWEQLPEAGRLRVYQHQGKYTLPREHSKEKPE